MTSLKGAMVRTHGWLVPAGVKEGRQVEEKHLDSMQVALLVDGL